MDISTKPIPPALLERLATLAADCNVLIDEHEPDHAETYAWLRWQLQTQEQEQIDEVHERFRELRRDLDKIQNEHAATDATVEPAPRSVVVNFVKSKRKPFVLDLTPTMTAAEVLAISRAKPASSLAYFNPAGRTMRFQDDTAVHPHVPSGAILSVVPQITQPKAE